MTAKVILNPYAGRWKAKERKGEIISALRDANVKFELVETLSPGHGSELAEDAVIEGFSPIIVAGGDGSVSEVVNGMMSCIGKADIHKLPPLGILPLGSANDLVFNLGLPLDIHEAVAVIVSGDIQKLDLGMVNSRFFDNNSAIGLEPTITMIQQNITRLRGVSRYLLATLIGILKNRSWQAKIEWEGGEYSGPITLVSVGNNPVTGGIFYVTPHADPFDGLLTFVYGYIPSRLKTLGILPKMLRPGEGNYVEHPDIHEIHTRWLKIHTEPSTPMHADGEIQSEAITDIAYKVHPASLPILMLVNDGSE